MYDSSNINRFPSTPGVYLMKGEGGTILYVGKAKNLRNRVRSYFSGTSDSRYHIQFLVNRVCDIEFIVTDTEKEALILENTLIKKYRPRYNFNLRDDKTYFSLRMDMKEEFPRISIIRKVTRDGARYFGPYSSGAAAREVLKQIYRIFPLRHYPLETCRRRKRPCLFYQLRQCSAPCHGKISPEEYATLAEGAALFLEGKSRDLIRVCQSRMKEAATAERFEEAARLRDLIRSIEVTVEKQKVVIQNGDMDVIGLFRDGNHLELAILFIRGGSLTGSRSFHLSWKMEDAEGIASFVNEYYGSDVYIPAEVLVPLPIPECAPLGELLSDRRGRRTTIACPVRGTKAELIRMASKNAETSYREKQEVATGALRTLEELQQRLNLERLPHHIECYDISNIQGEFAVGSRVSFRDGNADKAGYRHYRIRDISQADDFAMMREVLSRRFTPGSDVPDLIIVDGGIGQLNILRGVLDELGITGISLASLAKSRVQQDMTDETIRKSDERVFLPGRKNPVVLRQNSAPLLLLARIRDEAHRFAITYHRKLRGKGSLRSAIDDLPGIGEKRKKELLRHFGSLQNLKAASPGELEAVPGLGGKLARSIWTHLHENEEGGAT